jgi:ABC-2 type transport system permease protein
MKIQRKKPMNNDTPKTDTKALNRALLSSQKPPKANALSASLTFGWRALLKIKHVPEQLFDVTAFPVMFILMFTYLFGGALAGSTGEYLQYLLPGILAQTVIMLTMYTGLSLHNDIKKGIFDRFRSLPIWQPAVLTGALLGDALRYTVASLVIIVIGLVLGFQPGGGWTGMILAMGLLLIFSFSFSWIWTAVGIVVRTQESLYTLSFVILFPLTFISNIFVEPETMPSWLEAFVNVNPISILVTALRGLMHGGVTAGDITAVLMISAGMIAVFGPVTMYLFRRQK